MEQNTRTSNIRFVHIFDRDDTHQRGVTIAYQRTEDVVTFAWADKRPGEEYVKEIGRDFSRERLEDFLKDAAPTMVYGAFFIDHDEHVGALHVDFLRRLVATQNIWANSLVDQLNWFDIKHVALSKILAQFLQDAS